MTFAKTLIAAGVASLAMLGAAHAGTYGISIYNGNNPNTGNGGSPFEIALPNAGSIFSTTSAIYSGTYTGTVAFNEGTSGTNTIGAFLASGGGSLSAPLSSGVAGTTLTGGNFTTTTGISLTFTGYAGENLNITNDDGVSLYFGGTDLLPASAANPTIEAPNNVTLASTGTYTLYYIEANGLPADLNVNVPEPASLALLGAGLFGLGAIRRRKAGKTA